MSDELKVGDVCKEPERLRAGMRVRFVKGRDVVLTTRGESFVGWNRDDAGHLTDHYVCMYGVTILALPEESPPVAAPSLDEVPEGSRWREHGDDAFTALAFTVDSRIDKGATYRRYYTQDDGTKGQWTVDGILRNCTRIDEPAGAGKALQCAGIRWLDDVIGQACNQPGGHARPCTFYDITKPAMPPARCAPGCAPAKPCRITIPVTDKGTRYECPALHEDAVGRWTRAMATITQPRLVTCDQAESRAMRDQPWEPRSPMIGRYRFSRR